ncbi:exonuclease domain-containing protein [Altererythrobacter aquiaggeris]|uniref:exonuclease domain-containing protein n=1 Tax=Aestuarierythrobacter aquiaggeris TaxID=1898396 RepID=UPI00301850D7
MKFIAVDLETANPRMSSICQIGIVAFENGVETRSETILLDPQDYFDPYNVNIHGIDEAAVRGAPTFQQVHNRICELVAGEIVACHTHFDRVALAQACGLHELDPLPCNWLDTARVARRAWNEFSKTGYGLKNIASKFGIEFQHHDAESDARAAGLILIRAMQDTGFSPSEWVDRCKSSGTSSQGFSVKREGDGDGPLLGETITFTGSLLVPRRNAADMAHEAGAAVSPGVTKKTSLLVVGDQDIERLNGKSKSGKHRKAEALIEGGQSIRILGEADFMKLCKT